MTSDPLESEPVPGSGKEVSLSSQGAVVASMTALSRISGFLRDIVFSYFFGATAVADTFFVAFRIPNFFRRLFAEGAFAQAFIPVLTEYKETGDRELLLRFIASMFGNLSLVVTVFALVGVAFAPYLVLLFAPGFWTDPDRLLNATEMVRVTFPYIAFISLTAFAASILNAFHRYAVPAITPVILNLVLVASAVVVAPLFEEPIMALAWGVLVAGILQFICQMPSLRRLEVLVLPRIDWVSPGVRKVGRLFVPALFAGSVGQINALIGTMIASTLTVGSISWLYYSDRLMELPIGIIAIALGTVLLPNLSRLELTKDPEAFSNTIDWGLRVAVLLGLPAVAALFFFAKPLVLAIFYRGQMTLVDVEMTALALKAFAVGLIPLILVKVLAPAFFAKQDTRTPFRCAAISVAVNIIFSLLLIRWMGHIGIALATSLAAYVNFCLLSISLLRTTTYEPSKDFLVAFLSAVTGSVVMVFVLGWIVPDFSDWLSMSEIMRVFWVAISLFAGSALYLVSIWILGMRPKHFLHTA